MADDWNREHSVATLLVGMSMIDDEVDEAEMRALVEVLRSFPGVDPAAAPRIGQVAYKALWALDGDDSLIAVLQRESRALAEHLDRDTLERLHGELKRMAEADGEVHPLERRLLSAFQSTWGLS